MKMEVISLVKKKVCKIEVSLKNYKNFMFNIEY